MCRLQATHQGWLCGVEQEVLPSGIKCKFILIIKANPFHRCKYFLNISKPVYFLVHKDFIISSFEILQDCMKCYVCGETLRGAYFTYKGQPICEKDYKVCVTSFTRSPQTFWRFFVTLKKQFRRHLIKRYRVLQALLNNWRFRDISVCFK